MTWRLLLTRSLDDNAQAAGHLAAFGVHTASFPLLNIEPLTETPEGRSRVLDLDRYAAVVVVSRHAARLGLDRVDEYWPQPPLGPLWFAVGPGTAAVIEAYGIPACWPEQADSEGLLALEGLRHALSGPDARVLLMRGEGGRALLAEELAARGASVDELELYRRGLPHYPAGALLAQVEAERLNGLVVSSGQGFQHLMQLAGESWPALSELSLFVPSERVGDIARLSGARDVVVCEGASPDALIAALQRKEAFH